MPTHNESMEHGHGVAMPTYTLSELASLLRVRRGVISGWMNRNQNPLPYYRIHKKSFRFDLAEVREWMDENIKVQHNKLPHVGTGQLANVIPLNQKH